MEVTHGDIWPSCRPESLTSDRVLPEASRVTFIGALGSLHASNGHNSLRYNPDLLWAFKKYEFRG